MLNLKQLRLKLYSEEPVVLKLVKKGETEVFAKDIAKDSNVQIINPDLKIATLTTKTAELNMEIIVENGRGFEPTENRNKEKLSVGSIAVDAIFTPIKDVGYKVEYTRVGQITNYERLILIFETDGTISPEKALNSTAKLLIDHLTLLYKEGLEKEVEVMEKEPTEKKDVKTVKKSTAKKTAKKPKK